MGKTLGFISVKGGVGKTTLALETAGSLANHFDKKVLLVDANFSAPNLSLHLGIEPELTLHDVLAGEGIQHAIYEKHKIDVVPASVVYKKHVDAFKLSRALSKVKRRYDYVILDSSPHYSEMGPVVNASDILFVVTTPDIPTLNMSMKAAMIAKKNDTPIEGVIINKIRNHGHELRLQEIEDSMEIPVVAKIRDHRDMIESVHARIPMVLHRPKNIVSREIERFVSSLCGQPEKPSGFFQSFLPFKGLFHKEEINRQLLREKFYTSRL